MDKKKWDEIKSKECEEITKEWFSILGKVKKIPDHKGTYDYKIDGEKLLIEVCWINSENKFIRRGDSIGMGKELSDQDFFSKIQDKVKHICKPHCQFPKYRYGGIIFWDTLFDFLQDPPTHRHYNERFPFEYQIFDLDWEYLILIQETSIGNRPPAFIYVKKPELKDPLDRVFKNHNHVMFVLQGDQFRASKNRSSFIEKAES
jgi:hypothetical protein